jgi:hypothetical protein
MLGAVPLQRRVRCYRTIHLFMLNLFFIHIVFKMCILSIDRMSQPKNDTCVRVSVQPFLTSV